MKGGVAMSEEDDIYTITQVCAQKELVSSLQDRHKSSIV